MKKYKGWRLKPYDFKNDLHIYQRRWLWIFWRSYDFGPECMFEITVDKWIALTNK